MLTLGWKTAIKRDIFEKRGYKIFNVKCDCSDSRFSRFFRFKKPVVICQNCYAEYTVEEWEDIVQKCSDAQAKETKEFLGQYPIKNISGHPET